MGPVLERAARRAAAVAWQVVLVTVAALVYFGVRGHTEGSVPEAFGNAHTVERIEEALGIAWGHAFQAAVIGSETLVTAANWVYVYGHWPVIAAAAVLLYAFRRERYVLLRNAMFISGLCGFAFFAFFPVAPPRLVDPSLVDTVTLYSEGYRTLQPPSLTNQFAAMPSLHAGWNLLVGIVVFGATANLLLRALAVAMPAAMLFAVVATANHYVLDVVVGVLLVLAGLAVAVRMQPRTLRSGEPEAPTEGSLGRPTLRRRPSLGQLAREGPSGRARRRAGARGGRAPVPRSARAPSPQDRRPSAPVGPVDAREPVLPASRPR